MVLIAYLEFVLNWLENQKGNLNSTIFDNLLNNNNEMQEVKYTETQASV